MNYIPTNTLTKKEWLEGRKNYIGGSDVGAIIGLNPYKTATDIYLEKTGQKEPFEGNMFTEAGERLEPIIAEWYADQSGHHIRNDNKIRFHKEYNFLAANIDRLISDPERPGEPGILECKTISGYNARKWEQQDWPYPPHYYAQVQHYLNVTGHKWAVIAFLQDGREFSQYYIEPNPEFIAGYMEKVIDFWNNNILKEAPPEPQTADDVLKIHPYTEDDSAETEATQEIANKYEEMKRLKSEIDELKTQYDSLKDEVQVYMNDKAILSFNGLTLATWKSGKPPMRFDQKRFKKEHPDLAAKYTLPGNPVRRFILK